MDEITSDQVSVQRWLRAQATPRRVALVIVGLIVGWSAYKWLTAPTLEEVTKAIGELNKKLPVKADAMTRLDNVTLGDNEVIYRYTLVGAKSGGLDGADLLAVLEPQVRPAICSAPMLQTLMRNNYVVRYQYHANDRKLITQVVVKPGDCGMFRGGCELERR